ncbi:MAG TPA: hypothetical protein VM307_08255 [Egibacteraceae bacterium]|nr:hypothetical protein [Egibacteraceae bacterium]
MLRRPGTRRRIRYSQEFPTQEDMWVEQEWTGTQWRQLAAAPDEATLKQLFT